jgi:hypothetical protein
VYHRHAGLAKANSLPWSSTLVVGVEGIIFTEWDSVPISLEAYGNERPDLGDHSAIQRDYRGAQRLGSARQLLGVLGAADEFA